MQKGGGEAHGKRGTCGNDPVVDVAADKVAAVDAAFYSYSYCGTSHAPRTNPVLTKNLGPLIAKADELPVHSRKGLGNQKEKGGGVQGTGCGSYYTP